MDVYLTLTNKKMHRFGKQWRVKIVCILIVCLTKKLVSFQLKLWKRIMAEETIFNISIGIQPRWLGVIIHDSNSSRIG